MAKLLETFTITPSAEGYLIRIEDEDGNTTELIASFDQLDVISDEIEGVLNSDEENALEVDDDEDDAEPPDFG